MPKTPPPKSAVTGSIYLGTLAAIAIVAALSLIIYRSAVNDAIAQHSSQQLAMVRTAAVGVQGELLTAVRQPGRAAFLDPCFAAIMTLGLLEDI